MSKLRLTKEDFDNEIIKRNKIANLKKLREKGRIDC